MKRTTIILALLAFFYIATFGQKKYEMVIEKTDGTTVVINTEDILRTFFRERSDGTEGGDNGGGGSTISNPSELVGIWTQYHQDGNGGPGGYIGFYIGIKLGANGELAYDEWSNNATPDWTYWDGGKWSVSGNVINGYDPKGILRYSSTYTLSSDGKIITFEGDTTGGLFGTLKGEFIKQ